MMGRITSLAALVLLLDSSSLKQSSAFVVTPAASSTTASSTLTSLDSTYIREPQTFEKTNLGFSEPNFNTNGLSRSATSTRSGAREQRLNSNDSLFRQQEYAAPSVNDEITVHGGGVLRTWSFEYAYAAECANINVRTDGSPIDAAVELWEGPNYAPIHVRAYSQDGISHPISMKLLLDDSRSSSLAIRNTGPNTFPLQAAVTTTDIDANFQSMLDLVGFQSYEDDLQGGASLSYPLDSSVQHTQLMLRTDGRPLNARVELMQGPSNNKLVAEIQSMDGIPMVLSFETPGYANVLRVINLSPLEFPIVTLVDPSHIDPRGVEDRRRQYRGERYGDSNYDFRGSHNRRDRWNRNGNDLGFKSSSMNRNVDTSQRILASETNGRFGSAGKMEPWPGKNTFSPQGGYRGNDSSSRSASQNGASSSRFGSVSDRARLADQARIRNNGINNSNTENNSSNKNSNYRQQYDLRSSSSTNWYENSGGSVGGAREWWST